MIGSGDSVKCAYIYWRNEIKTDKIKYILVSILQYHLNYHSTLDSFYQLHKIRVKTKVLCTQVKKLCGSLVILVS